MPICVTGMHRSGTSMVARLLNLCGVDLGATTDLLPPNVHNPEGFWEHRDFLLANDRIISAAGGTWDSPPPERPAGWEQSKALARCRQDAGRLVGRFCNREPWGWKDPRSCLTLPLWQSVIPGLKVVICVRNPLAVAGSMWVRDGKSYAESLDLWLTYNQRALAATPRESRVVTHYESYFRDADAELRRVLSLLGLLVPDATRNAAGASVKPSLVHHRAWPNWAATGEPAEIDMLYRSLCAEGDHREAAESAKDDPGHQETSCRLVG
jgi:hypothetical protein